MEFACGMSTIKDLWWVVVDNDYWAVVEESVSSERIFRMHAHKRKFVAVSSSHPMICNPCLMLGRRRSLSLVFHLLCSFAIMKSIEYTRTISDISRLYQFCNGWCSSAGQHVIFLFPSLKLPVVSEVTCSHLSDLVWFGGVLGSILSYTSTFT